VSAPTALHPSDLEPSLVGQRTYVSRRRPPRLDAAVVIGAMICLLLLIPARLIVPGTTELGRPALVLCLLMFFWWVQVRLTSQHLVLMGPQPLRWALLVFSIAMLVSYAIGQLRGLTALEANGADSFMLFTGAFAGVVLMTADGISNWVRLQLVIKLLVWCGAFVGLVGLLQYVLKFDVTEYLDIPGLEAKRAAARLRGTRWRHPGRQHDHPLHRAEHRDGDDPAVRHPPRAVRPDPQDEGRVRQRRLPRGRGHPGHDLPDRHAGAGDRAAGARTGVELAPPLQHVRHHLRLPRRLRGGGAGAGGDPHPASSTTPPRTRRSPCARSATRWCGTTSASGRGWAGGTGYLRLAAVPDPRQRVAGVPHQQRHHRRDRCWPRCT
jgi:hypothetical protein